MGCITVLDGLSDLDARSDENWAVRVDQLCGGAVKAARPRCWPNAGCRCMANGMIQQLLLI